MTDRTIRWGIIGCGDVTEVKSGPGFQQADHSQLVAVMRRTARLAEDYAHRHEVPHWFDNADAVIHHPDVDAIYVATPPASHRDFALQIATAGKPAYIEKPMARTAAECRAMVDAFRDANLPLFVAYYRRALPRFLKVQEILASGELGVLTSVNYRFSQPLILPENEPLPWRLNAEQAGGGLFFDLGSHALDILDFLLGPLVKVQGLARNLAAKYDVEDNVHLTFETEQGVPGTAVWNFSGGRKVDEIEILTSNGAVHFSVFGTEPIEITRIEANGITTIEEVGLPNPRHIQQPLIQSIVNYLCGEGENPSPGHSALRTAEIMDTVVMNYYGSRDEGFWQSAENWPGFQQ